jgi:hypothetical protein
MWDLETTVELKDLAKLALVIGVAKADAFLWICQQVKKYDQMYFNERYIPKCYQTVGDVDKAVAEAYD